MPPAASRERKTGVHHCFGLSAALPAPDCWPASCRPAGRWRRLAQQFVVHAASPGVTSTSTMSGEARKVSRLTFARAYFVHRVPLAGGSASCSTRTAVRPAVAPPAPCNSGSRPLKRCGDGRNLCQRSTTRCRTATGDCRTVTQLYFGQLRVTGWLRGWNRRGRRSRAATKGSPAPTADTDRRRRVSCVTTAGLGAVGGSHRRAGCFQLVSRGAFDGPPTAADAQAAATRRRVIATEASSRLRRSSCNPSSRGRR